MTTDGGPAFPTVMSVEVENGDVLATKAVDGMSLRDYFAGQALVGMCANAVLAEHIGRKGHGELVDSAYVIADAMLKERAKS